MADIKDLAKAHLIKLLIAEIKKNRTKRCDASSKSSTISTTISTSSIEDVIDRLKYQRVCESTKKNYQSVWKTFNEFFIKLDRKPRKWEDRILLFVGYLIDTKKAKSQTIKSYLSAICATLKNEDVELDENLFMLNSLTRACQLQNDTYRVRLPIQKPLLRWIIKTTKEMFESQPYLSILYRALFSAAYFGLFRVSELTKGEHGVKVTDVHIGVNKDKFLFVLRSSKTHGKYVKPQQIKVSAQTDRETVTNENKEICPFTLLRQYSAARPDYFSQKENFFVFRDFTPVTVAQMRSTLRTALQKAGFQSKAYCTQSFRAGRSVDLLEAGVSVKTIRKLGRWSSNAVYTYLK